MAPAAADEERQIETLCDDIVRYLQNNPNARDTFEGILSWWLLEGEIRREGEKVRRALERLVAAGLVAERQRSDGQVHYMLGAGLAEHAETEEGRDEEA